MRTFVLKNILIGYLFIHLMISSHPSYCRGGTKTLLFLRNCTCSSLRSQSSLSEWPPLRQCRPRPLGVALDSGVGRPGWWVAAPRSLLLIGCTLFYTTLLLFDPTSKKVIKISLSYKTTSTTACFFRWFGDPYMQYNTMYRFFHSSTDYSSSLVMNSVLYTFIIYNQRYFRGSPGSHHLKYVTSAWRSSPLYISKLRTEWDMIVTQDDAQYLVWIAPKKVHFYSNYIWTQNQDGVVNFLATRKSTDLL